MDQCIGDTLGPGGVFRAMRTIPVLLDIARDMEEVSKPGAIMLQYANPMAGNCLALGKASTVSFVGLCHGVQTTIEQIAQFIERAQGGDHSTPAAASTTWTGSSP